ncbi:MAG TPA: hypothetical protein VNE39_21860 [Planctomycetota bacterium]|nr:hypothetical protein [Planctomycetota bacterium]
MHDELLPSYGWPLPDSAQTACPEDMITQVRLVFHRTRVSLRVPLRQLVSFLDHLKATYRAKTKKPDKRPFHRVLRCTVARNTEFYVEYRARDFKLAQVAEEASSPARCWCALQFSGFSMARLEWMQDQLDEWRSVFGLKPFLSSAELAIDLLVRDTETVEDDLLTLHSFVVNSLHLPRTRKVDQRYAPTIYFDDTRSSPRAMRLYLRPFEQSPGAPKKPDTEEYRGAPRVRAEYCLRGTVLKKWGIRTLRDLSVFRFSRVLACYSFVDVNWGSFEGAFYRKMGANTPRLEAIARELLFVKADGEELALQGRIIVLRKFLGGGYPQLGSRFMEPSAFHHWLLKTVQRQDKARLSQF